MDTLGKMIRITDLRSVWPHEANDFTKWLAQEENLTLLGDAKAIGVELSFVDKGLWELKAKINKNTNERNPIHIIPIAR